MQFDLQRAFPYPVLRLGVNDYTDGEFQSVVEFAPIGDKPHIVFEAQFALSVDEISALIRHGDAKYVAVISCRDTYLRRVLSTAKPNVKTTFASGDLRGEVQVFPYIVAERQISDFRCPLINKEFGPGPFSFAPGAVIAVDEPKAAYIDRDLFKPITSVFELVKNESIQGAEWRIDSSGDHVRIQVAPHMKEKIDNFRNSARNRAILLNSIYFAAVMQCIRHIARGEEYDDRRWARVIREQCHNHHLNLDSQDEYAVAQQLLQPPLGMLDTYLFDRSGE